MSNLDNKPGVVHYALVVFVMLSTVLAITTYMFHRESQDALAAQTQYAKEINHLKESLTTLQEENQKLKDLDRKKSETTEIR